MITSKCEKDSKTQYAGVKSFGLEHFSCGCNVGLLRRWAFPATRTPLHVPSGIRSNRKNALALCSWLVLPIVASPLPALPRSASYQAHSAAAKDGGQLRQFKIQKPNFVVDGAHLSSVEVWCWPAGTGITKPTLVGKAVRITAPGEHEKWVLRIPPDLLSTEIFATVFDRAGNEIAKKSLPYKGASALYEALYGKK